MPSASTALVVEMLALQYSSPEIPHSARVFPVPYHPHAVCAGGNHPPPGEGLWAVREEVREWRMEKRSGGKSSMEDFKGCGTKT